MILLMFGMLIFFIMLGIPIGFSIGLTSLVTLLIIDKANLMPSLAQSMYAQATSYPLLAIPFFILAGTLMNTGGITDRVFRFAKCLVGHLHGGLGHVNVVASMLFAGMSGSAVADAAGLGKVEIKAMIDAGYDRRFSAGITAASSTIGPVIPPSIPFVIYGAITGVSVGSLFLGGFLPGVGMGLALMVSVAILSRRRGYPKDRFPNIRVILMAAKDGLPALGAPVIIIGGIISGLFTPTEAAVIASAYSLFIGVLLGEIVWANIGAIFYEAFVQTIKIMFIIVTAAMFGWLLVYLRGPDQILHLFTSFTSNPKLILIMIILLLLILGCFMESIAIILTVVPMFAPLVDKMGLDPVHFGVIVVLSLMIGLITPPVGMSIFAVSAISGLPPESVIREMTPYILALMCLLLLVAFWPSFTLFIPNLFLKGI